MSGTDRPYAGDGRPVHFTRTEVQRMINRLRGRRPTVAASEAEVAEVRQMLGERLDDTDRMLDAWDAPRFEGGDEVTVHDPTGDMPGRIETTTSTTIYVQGPPLGGGDSRSWSWRIPVAEAHTCLTHRSTPR